MYSRRCSGMRSNWSIRNHTLKLDMSFRRAVLSTMPMTSPRPRSMELVVRLVHMCAGMPTSANGTRNRNKAAVACACRS